MIDLSSLDKHKAYVNNAGEPFVAKSTTWINASRLMIERFKQHNQENKQLDLRTINHWFSAYPTDHWIYNKFCDRITEKGALPHLKSVGYTGACERLLEVIKQHDQHDLIKKVTCADDGTAVNINGYSVTWDHLMSLYAVSKILDHLPHLIFGQRLVVDVGPGWGRLGHVLMQVNPDLTYLMLDLPESLVVGQELMTRFWSDKRSIITPDKLHNTANINKDFFKKPSLAFACTPALDNIDDGAIDLLMCVNALQEIVPSSIDLYYELFAKKSQATYVFAGDHHQKWGGGMNDLSSKAFAGMKRLMHVKTGDHLFYHDYFESLWVKQ